MSRLELLPQITHHLDMSQVRGGVFQGMSDRPARLIYSMRVGLEFRARMM